MTQSIHRRQLLQAGGAFVTGAVLSNESIGQDASSPKWPSRTVRLLVGFPPGGGSDFAARAVSHKLQASLRAPVIVENKPGAQGSVAAASLATSALDDHAFMVVPPGVQAINQFLYKSVGYDSEKDFVSVGLIAQSPNILVVNNALPVNTLHELIALAKRRPGELNYSIAGVGATSHLLVELLKLQTGVQMVHIPYKGSGPALHAAVSGEVAVNANTADVMLENIKGGKVKALAISSEKRWTRELPDVPTFAELGFPELTMLLWHGVIAQAKMPQYIVSRMNREINAALAEPDIAALLRNVNREPMPGSPLAMSQLVRMERERWKKVIEVSGARLE